MNSLIVALLLLAADTPDALSPAEAAFRDLASLEGNWESDGANGRTHTINFRLTANGTALVETWTMSSARESITIYSIDGDTLFSVHYCPQGNQPRLKYSGKSGAGALKFEFVDGGNLSAEGASHQYRFSVLRSGPDSFRRSEIYVANDATPGELAETPEGETATYTRKKEWPASPQAAEGNPR